MRRARQRHRAPQLPVLTEDGQFPAGGLALTPDAGCGGGLYCPQGFVPRANAAVLLLKAEHGTAYVPPPCTGVFPDVACPSAHADWIEQLAAEGVTTGCGGDNYCPNANSTRGQMAVFLEKVSTVP
jgi:hypothetical protein